ncbi:MAG: DUF2130 domain-containing protein, partial [Pseudomonadota bacterium]
MSDDLTVPCPNCGHAVPLTETLAGPIRAEAEAEFEARLAAQAATAEEAALQKVQAELARRDEAAQAREQAMAALQADLNTAKQAERDAKNQQAKALKAARDLEDRAAALDLEIEQRLSAERAKLAAEQKALADKRLAAQQAAAAEAAKAERDAQQADHDQKMREQAVQMDAMRRQIEALKQKSEQGSMQAQGEAAELILEDQLRRAFPADSIAEVGKGIRGADCLQTVAGGAGTLLWESKRTQNWSNDWAPKLRADLRTAGADLAVLVSTARPEGIETFEARDGIWICAPRFALALAGVLRHSLIEVAQARAARQG